MLSLKKNVWWITDALFSVLFDAENGIFAFFEACMKDVHLDKDPQLISTRKTLVQFVCALLEASPTSTLFDFCKLLRVSVIFSFPLVSGL